LSGALSVFGRARALATFETVTRRTTFRFCLDPTVEQVAVLERVVGASWFAYNAAR
jgi:putative transposase